MRRIDWQCDGCGHVLLCYAAPSIICGQCGSAMREASSMDPGDEDDATPDRLWNRGALIHRYLFIRGKTVVMWPASRVYHPDHDPGDEEPTMRVDYGAVRYMDSI